jgi:hypothetical protein
MYKVRMLDDEDAAPSSGLWLWIRAAVILLIVLVMAQVSLERGSQVAGVAVLAQALMFLRKRRVPYGWRGAPPSGYFTGYSAVAVAMLLCAAGLFLIFKSSVAADLFRLCCEKR